MGCHHAHFTDEDMKPGNKPMVTPSGDAWRSLSRQSGYGVLALSPSPSQQSKEPADTAGYPICYSPLGEAVGEKDGSHNMQRCFVIFNSTFSTVGLGMVEEMMKVLVSQQLRPCGHHCQTPLSMGFSRQEYWSGQPFPSLGDLLDPGTELRSPALQADSLLSEPPQWVTYM